MMKKTNNHDVCSLFKSSISRTHKVLAASVVLAAGLLYGCSDSDVTEGEGTDPVESEIKTQAITVNNNPASHADRITLYDDEGGVRSRAGEEYKLTELALIAPPRAIDGNEKDRNLSATCVYPHNINKIYVCYHLNEEYKDNAGLVQKNKHQGAIELIKCKVYKDENNNDKLEVEIRSQLVNDYQDFNHCTVLGTTMYTTGDTEDGAWLGRIKLNEKEDGFAKQDTMDVFKLKGGSGNCVAKSANEFLIATNKGFQTVNKNWKSNKKEELVFFETDASAKHIALFKKGNDEGIVTLHLKDKYSLGNEYSATAVIQKGWGKGAEVLNTQKKYEITPTDGKNTIAVYEEGVVYVCLGENGVVKLDMETGAELGKYCLTENRPDYQGKACANGVDVDVNYVYIAYGGYGLVVLDKTNMKELTRYVHREEVEIDGKKVTKAVYSANYVAVDKENKKINNNNNKNKLIYVAYGRNGLGILRLDKN